MTSHLLIESMYFYGACLAFEVWKSVNFQVLSSLPPVEALETYSELEGETGFEPRPSNKGSKHVS